MPLVAIALLGSFDARQRKWIKTRDSLNKNSNNQGICQFPESHLCNGDIEIQVHHIIPQRYATDRGIDPDYPENGLSLCSNSHIGEIRPGEPGVHPDILEARQRYRSDNDSYKQVFDARQKKLENKEIYWNSKWDRLLTVLGVRNTQRFINKGNYFPKHNGKH